MLRRRKKMTRMHMKMMLTNMTMMLILKVMATKVLRVKFFAVGKILNQMSSWLFMLAIFTTTLTAIKSKKKMTRMYMKMMLTNMTKTSILKVMAKKVLNVKTFAIWKILNQMFLIFYLSIFTTTLTAIKSKKLFRKPYAWKQFHLLIKWS